MRSEAVATDGVRKVSQSHSRLTRRAGRTHGRVNSPAIGEQCLPLWSAAICSEGARGLNCWLDTRDWGIYWGCWIEKR
jgi:hypothetical protein